MRRPLGPALGYLLPTYGSAAHLIRNNDPSLIPSLSAKSILLAAARSLMIKYWVATSRAL